MFMLNKISETDLNLIYLYNLCNVFNIDLCETHVLFIETVLLRLNFVINKNNVKSQENILNR